MLPCVWIWKWKWKDLASSCLIYEPLKAIKKMLYFPFSGKVATSLGGSNQALVINFLMGLVNNEASDQIMT